MTTAADLPWVDGAVVRWEASDEGETYRRVAVCDLSWTPGRRVWLFPCDERDYSDRDLLRMVDGVDVEVWA